MTQWAEPATVAAGQGGCEALVGVVVSTGTEEKAVVEMGSVGAAHSDAWEAAAMALAGVVGMGYLEDRSARRKKCRRLRATEAQSM